MGYLRVESRRRTCDCESGLGAVKPQFLLLVCVAAIHGVPKSHPELALRSEDQVVEGNLREANALRVSNLGSADRRQLPLVEGAEIVLGRPWVGVDDPAPLTAEVVVELTT